MVVVLVVVGLVVAFLLWRMLQVQQVRARAEMANLTVTIAKTMHEQLNAQLGSYEAAKEKQRLIEYVDGMKSALKLSDDEIADELSLSRSHQFRRDLAAESFERGIRCAYLQHSDYDSLHYGVPQPEPRLEMDCAKQCAGFMEEPLLPADLDRCPFCEGPLEAADDKLHQKWLAEWRRDTEAWQRYWKLFPDHAAELEAPYLAERVEAERRQAERFVTAVAAAKAKRETSL